MKINKKLLAAPLLIAGLVLAGCSSGGGGTEPAPAPPSSNEDTNTQEQETEEVEFLGALTVPMITVSGFGGPQFIAQDEGLWEKYGLDVSQPVSKPDATAFGQVPLQVAAGGWGIAKASGGEANVWLATLQDIPVFDLYVAAEIDSVADLAGKKVGVTAQGGGPYNAMLNFLESEGLTIDDVDVVFLQSTTTIYQALANGDIVAGPLSPPTNFMASNLDKLKLLVPFEELDVNPSVVLAAEPGWLAENPKMAEAWLKGYIEAQWIYTTNPEVAKAALANHLEYDLNNAEDVAVVDAVYEDYLRAHPIPIQAVSQTEIENMLGVIAGEQRDWLSENTASILDSSIIDGIYASNFLDELEAEYGPLP